MAKELGDIVKSNPPYYMASHLLSSDADREEVELWQKENNIEVPWCCTSGIFHSAFVEDKMQMFFDALKDREVLLIGPNNLMKCNKIDFKAITVSSVNCWEDTYETLIAIDYSFEMGDIDKDTVILYCASMAANVWIDKIYKDYPEITQIDLGSALDPYCGVLSRSFHRKNQHLIK